MNDHRSKVKALIERETGHCGVQIRSTSDLPSGGNSAGYIYLITNGGHVLQIGKSVSKSRSRLRCLLPGARPGIHNKSFIVGLAPAAFGRPNEFWFFESSNPANHETRIHSQLGVKTNRDPCVFFDGTKAGSIAEAEKFIFESFIKSKGHKYFADELDKFKAVLQLVLDGVKFKRSGSNAKYSSGDCLNGTVLKGAERLALVPIWEKMTEGYFKYSHSYHGHGDQPVSKLAPESSKRRGRETTNHGTYDTGVAPDVELIITRKQLNAAQFYLDSDEGEKKGRTCNFFFETTDPYFVLEVEKPSGTEKLEDIVKAFGDSDIYVLSNLELTGKATGNQYFSVWPGSYVVKKKSKFDGASGRHYFAQ